MLPLWPFNRRRLLHRTFGQIHPIRNGKFWRAAAPLGKGFESIELCINAGESGPTEEQEKLFLLLQTHFRKVLQAALKSLHPEYQRVVHAHPRVRWPVVTNLKEQLKATRLDRVWIEDAHGRRFVLSFQASADKEQQFHVFFHHWKVENVSSERF